MRKINGFSLIEMVVFILVLGIAIAGIFTAFTTAEQNTSGSNAQLIATYLAQGRMDFIVGQKQINGYSSFSDLCAGGSPPAICTIPAALNGFTINSSIAAETINSDTNFKLITVTVTGPQQSAAKVTTVVGA